MYIVRTNFSVTKGHQEKLGHCSRVSPDANLILKDKWLLNSGATPRKRYQVPIPARNFSRLMFNLPPFFYYLGMRTRVIGFIILAIVGLTLSECSSADRDESGVIVSSGDVQANETQVGDCYNELPTAGESFSSVKAVPCNEAHQYQLFYRTTSSLSSYSADALRLEASRVCNEAADELMIGMSAIKYDAFKNAQLGVFYPTSKSWNSRNDRKMDCLIGGESETYFTSVFE